MSVENVITGSTPAATPDTAAAATNAAATPPAEDIAAVKAELEALKGQLSEKERAAQFWYEKARSGAPAEPAKAAAAEPEEDVDLLDLIATKGPKGFDAYMRKRGYVSREEVDAAVNSKAAQLSAESELLGRYPELGKRDSDFFKSTAVHYGELKKQGVPEALAMRLGAERAELDAIKAGKVKTVNQQSADEKAEKEAQRQARIRAQAGDKNARATEANPDDDELTDYERHICRAMGVSEDAYKARAKKGVQLGGIKGR
jgi:hypothetical protein